MASRISILTFLVLSVVIPAARALDSPPAAAQAAVVNGEVIPETAVQRALKGIPAAHQAKARPQVVNLLIENMLVEQYLVQQKVDAPAKEVADRMVRIRDEAKKSGQEYEKLLAQLGLTEAELRTQVAADLRWENHVKAQAPDDVLAKFFASNKEWFDGSQVAGRHVLIEVAAGADAATKQAAVAKLNQVKQGVEAQVAQELAKLDPKLDSLAREQARLKFVTQAFAEAASKHSTCPSSKHGGDLGYFPRVGAMVEPFAKAAFALQPGQIAGPLETQFGWHLILVTARTPGKDVKFDDIKDEVREIVSDRLREDLVAQLRKSSRIEIVAPPPQADAKNGGQ